MHWRTFYGCCGEIHIAGLNVLRTVAKSLLHLNVKSIPIHYSHPAVDAIAAASRSSRSNGAGANSMTISDVFCHV